MPREEGEPINLIVTQAIRGTLPVGNLKAAKNPKFRGLNYPHIQAILNIINDVKFFPGALSYQSLNPGMFRSAEASVFDRHHPITYPLTDATDI